jgi:hypothetical protein
MEKNKKQKPKNRLKHLRKKKRLKTRSTRTPIIRKIDQVLRKG